MTVDLPLPLFVIDVVRRDEKLDDDDVGLASNERCVTVEKIGCGHNLPMTSVPIGGIDHTYACFSTLRIYHHHNTIAVNNAY